MNKLLIQFVAGVVFALSGSIAQATIITFAYSATENSGLGGTVTGTFGYDDSVSDTDPTLEFGFYPGAGFLEGTVS